MKTAIYSEVSVLLQVQSEGEHRPYCAELIALSHTVSYIASSGSQNV